MTTNPVFDAYLIITFIVAGILILAWSITLYLLFTKRGRELCVKHKWLTVFIK